MKSLFIIFKDRRIPVIQSIAWRLSPTAFDLDLFEDLAKVRKASGDNFSQEFGLARHLLLVHDVVQARGELLFQQVDFFGRKRKLQGQTAGL